jgi:hypothetical protein
VHSSSCATLLLAITASIPVASAQTPPVSHKRPATSSSAASAAPAPAPCPTPSQYHPQPYTIKQQVTHSQTLTNGTNVNTSEEVLLARDSDGRTRREETHAMNGDVTRYVSIFDPTTQTRYSWNEGANLPRTVMVYRIHPLQSQAPVSPARRYYPNHSESLPPQTIAGWYTEGVRYTRTIPAGYAGNDHDLVTTTESWNSPDLGIVLRTVSDDPRSGKSTTDTTDIQRTAPDPSLFQPPQGYQLKEQNQ